MLRRTNTKYLRMYVRPLAALPLLALAACSSDDALRVDEVVEAKTPIELTMGIVGDGASVSTHSSGNTTRAVVTTDMPYNKLALAFEKGTSLYMVMKSTEDDADPLYTRTIGYGQEQIDANNTDVLFADNYGRYYEDSHSRASQLSVYAACVPGYYLANSVYAKPSDYSGTWPNGTLDGTTWTIGSSATYANGWSSASGSTIIGWPIDRTADDDVTSQTANFITSQDLCFSNNVSRYESGTDPVTGDPVYTDNRITFNTSTRKFEGKRLVFYHALTRVTFKIKKGEGFESATFAFTDNGTATDTKNMVMVGFNTSGTFDITDGEFKTTASSTINKLHISTDNREKTAVERDEATRDYEYIIDGLMLPGSDLYGSDKDDTHTVHFEIDGNLYHVTKKQLADALEGKTLSDNSTSALEAVGTSKLMRPGVHYVFEMTVGKRKMDHLTSSVVPWETVATDQATPSNARILVYLLKNGELVTGAANFDLYRLADVNTGAISDDFTHFEWMTGYAPTESPNVNRADLTETTASGVYKADEYGTSDTPWYWPDNKTFYHFRALMPVEQSITPDGTDGDYITLTGADSYTDVCWGAPFVAKNADLTKPDNTEEKLTYSVDTGFDNTQAIGSSPSQSNHQISKAIGPTKSQINLELFHMMSDVTIVLTTTKGSDAVTIAGATVSLSDIYPNAKVRMGTGKVEPYGTLATPGGTVNAECKWNHGFVPQALTDVVLTIQTDDHNLYEVDMKDVVATTVGSNLIKNPYRTNASGKYIIDRWYPNYKYTYTFKLTKSDIKLITATLANWETVNADEETVQIK